MKPLAVAVGCMSEQEEWSYELEPQPETDIGTFQEVDIRVGRVVEVGEYPEARTPSYRLVVDLGPLGTRKSIAALAEWYEPEELRDRRVLCVVNFPPRQIGSEMSEVLTMGAVQRDGRVALVGAGEDAAPGSRVY